VARGIKTVICLKETAGEKRLLVIVIRPVRKTKKALRNPGGTCKKGGESRESVYSLKQKSRESGTRRWKNK